EEHIQLICHNGSNCVGWRYNGVNQFAKFWCAKLIICKRTQFQLAARKLGDVGARTGTYVIRVVPQIRAVYISRCNVAQQMLWQNVEVFIVQKDPVFYWCWVFKVHYQCVVVGCFDADGVACCNTVVIGTFEELKLTLHTKVKVRIGDQICGEYPVMCSYWSTIVEFTVRVQMEGCCHTIFRGFPGFSSSWLNSAGCLIDVGKTVIQFVQNQVVKGRTARRSIRIQRVPCSGQTIVDNYIGIIGCFCCGFAAFSCFLSLCAVVCVL